MFQSLDIFIFTLGLTEAWEDKQSGTIFPSIPGSILGKYDPDNHIFRGFTYEECVNDFNYFLNRLSDLRENKPFKVLLTVSPVPLTATATRNTFWLQILPQNRSCGLLLIIFAAIAISITFLAMNLFLIPY